jgi:phosphate transport system substrate-binding protein
MKFVKKVAVPAALVAAFTCGHAASADTLYGGGATLPAIAYVGNGFFTTNQRLTDPAPSGSLFGSFTALTGDTVSYCQTGSGFGRGVLEGVDNASLTCPSFAISFSSPSTTYGFSASTMDGNFVASDAPLGLSDYNAFLTNQSSRTEPVQVPEIAGSIAMIYNVTGRLPLTDTQICKIFAGQITNWSSLGYPSQAITVVYRSDGSGTSFGMSNHLSTVCPALGVTGFSTQTSFINAFPGATAPTGAIAESGNPNVVNEIAQVSGSIGYGETADAVARLTSGINYATVNGYDPLSDFAASFKVTTSDVMVDTIINGDTSTGVPNLETLSAAGVTVPHAGCVQLVEPSVYANPKKTYPIMAVTYLMGYYSGNGADATEVATLLGAGYNSTIKGTTTTIGAGTGFAYISSYNPTKSKRGAPSIIGACITQ